MVVLLLNLYLSEIFRPARRLTILCNLVVVDKRYQDFASWVLSDLAVRVTEPNGWPVVFVGNHIQHVYVDRTQAPRHSDYSIRLALAMESYKRAGEVQSTALSLVFEGLQKASANPPAVAAELNAIGKAYPRPDFPMGKTKRSNRTRPKRTGWPPIARSLESLRTQVARYRRTHPEFQSRFEMWFGAFVADFNVSEGWLERPEPVYGERLVQVEDGVCLKFRVNESGRFTVRSIGQRDNIYLAE